MPSHTPAKRKLVRSIKAKIRKSGMAGKVTSGGLPQRDPVRNITEKRMRSTRRGS